MTKEEAQEVLVKLAPFVKACDWPIHTITPGDTAFAEQLKEAKMFIKQLEVVAKQ